MADYIDNVLNASGGHAAPAENLKDKDIRKSLEAAGMLIPEEQDLADALLEIVDKYGKFNDDNTGVWAGYTSAKDNAETASIGVKCGNCIFWEAPNGCKLIVAETEEGGLCRFAVLPDGAVTADAGGYGGECPPATQDIQLNLKNRQNAIDNVGYGPLNPAEPNEEFWQEKADRWNTDIEEAKSAVCGNCIFFIRTPKVLDCLETGIGLDQEAEGTIAAGELGYCSALDFKCASERTCNAWAAGGPITEDSENTMTTVTQTDDDSAVTASNLEKNENDPCWDGYVQVGMKNKNGKRVPNCVPSAAAIDFAVESYNSKYGASRHVTSASAYAVAQKSLEKYDYLEDDEVYSAIMWELTGYLEYALSGSTPTDFDASEFSELLTEGHPDVANSTLTASIEWLAGDSDLDNSARSALLSAFSDAADYVTSLHSSTRLRALASSGALPERTINYLITLSTRYSKVN